MKGQKVWLEGRNIKTFHPSSKLAPKRHGPFVIESVISPVAYKLALPSHWKIHNVFYANLLTPYKETDAHGPNFTSPPPEIIEGEPEYEVECILASRCFSRHRKLQYLVKWQGYPSSKNSWQNAMDMHTPDLIREFQAWQQPPQQQGAARPRRGAISHEGWGATITTINRKVKLGPVSAPCPKGHCLGVTCQPNKEGSNTPWIKEATSSVSQSWEPPERYDGDAPFPDKTEGPTSHSHHRPHGLTKMNALGSHIRSHPSSTAQSTTAPTTLAPLRNSVAPCPATSPPTVLQTQQPLILLPLTLRRLQNSRENSALPCPLPADPLPPLALAPLPIFLAFAPALPMAHTKDSSAHPSPYHHTGRPSAHMTTTNQPSPFCLNNNEMWTDRFPSIPTVMDGTAPPDPRTTPYYDKSSPYTLHSYIPPMNAHPWDPPSLPLFPTNLPSLAGLDLLAHDKALHSSIYDYDKEEAEEELCYPDTLPPSDSNEEPSVPPPVNHCITIDMTGVHNNEEAVLYLEAMLEHMQDRAPGEDWELVSGCIRDLQEAFRTGKVTIHTTRWPEVWSTTSLEDAAGLVTFPCLPTPSPPLLLAPIMSEGSHAT
jgi:Chromo (CHRromatin Organisation MOdifier) domain